MDSAPRRDVDVAVGGTFARVVVYFDEVVAGQYMIDDPGDVTAAEQDCLAYIHSFVVRRHVELGSVYRHPTRTQAAHLVEDEALAVFDRT
jgi:hypothetical protein